MSYGISSSMITLIKEYSLSPTRNTIEKADKDFAPYHDTFKWQPMYLLGFRLKEN